MRTNDTGLVLDTSGGAVTSMASDSADWAASFIPPPADTSAGKAMVTGAAAVIFCCSMACWAAVVNSFFLISCTCPQSAAQAVAAKQPVIASATSAGSVWPRLLVNVITVSSKGVD